MAESEKKKPYEAFAEKITAMLKQGVAPWQKSWKAGEYYAPLNPASGTVYRGINRLMLSTYDLADPRWLTFKQAQEKGWRVKAGSKARQVEFWQWTTEVERKDENGNVINGPDGQPEKEHVKLERPRVYYFSVFHASQLETADRRPIPAHEIPPLEWNPHDKAEAILNGSDALISHDQRDRAYYAPKSDEIHLPYRENFSKAGDYYNTALHELGHWACSKGRLELEGGVFGSEGYAREELRVEIASWMICQELGLDFEPESSAAYVAHWAKFIEEDPHEIVRACRDAEKIREYVLSMERGYEQGVKGEQTRPTEQEPTQEKAVEARPATEKTFLSVPFAEKDEARVLGARWDGQAKQWYAPEGADMAKLEKWRPAEQEPTQEKAVEARPATEKTFLSVPFAEKNEARALGAKWDGQAKLWYAPEGADMAQLERWRPGKEPVPAKTMNPEEEFATALARAGFRLDGPPIMDGAIHRAAVEGGKPGNRDGAYCAYLDGQPNGWLHNYKTGDKTKWMSTGLVLTEEQKTALKVEAAEHAAAREKEREAGYKAAMAAATKKLYQEARQVNDHVYLDSKGLGAHCLRVAQDKDGNLLVPGYDIKRGEPGRLQSQANLQTIQTITREGKKYFEAGCPKKGAMLILNEEILNRTELDAKPEILVAEGFATAASLNLATGNPVAVAFDAGNLLPVAQNLKEKFPESDITICADNDHYQEKNVGLLKAEEAAKAVDGRVIAPLFTKEEMGKGLTDFNDLHQSRGLEAVKAAVLNRESSQAITNHTWQRLNQTAQAVGTAGLAR